MLDQTPADLGKLEAALQAYDKMEETKQKAQTARDANRNRHRPVKET